MASRICQVRDATVTRLADWIAAHAAGSATIVATRRIEIQDTQPTARTVFVMGIGYGQDEPATRATDWNSYRVGVIVVERFGDPGDPPDSWADDLSAWVEANIFNPLQVVGVRASDEVVAPAPGPEWGELYCDTAEVPVECDLEGLQEHKLFWSELMFSFREDA